MSFHRDDDGVTRLPDGEGTDFTLPVRPGESSAKTDARAAAPDEPPAVTASDAKPSAPGDAHDTAQFAAGEAFGARYLIIKLLGMGGMGAVYQAWDQELGVAVALKVIRPEATPDPKAAAEMERRFKRELLLARQVTHTNVVRIHDLGELKGIKYISMPYVEGEDLSTRLKRETKLAIKDALSIARQMGAGLEAAHQAGVVHRDLKPANIMIGADAHVLIMDFGIARSGSSAVRVASAAAQVPPGFAGVVTGTMTLDITPAPASLAETIGGFGGDAIAPFGGAHSLPSGMVSLASMTRGGIVGTVAYMAPEQARAGAVDHRADIYAFGMILSEMLVGRRRTPAGMNAVEALHCRISEAPAPLREALPELPESLDALILKCLQIDPADRYQTTSELVAALARLDDEGHLIPEPVVRRFTPRLIASGVLLVAALMSGTWWLTRTPPPPKPHDPVTVLIADFQNATGDPSFDRTLEQTLRRALEGASFITAYDRTRIRPTFGVAPPDNLDQGAARALAVKQGLGIILAGSIALRGNGYELSVKATQPLTGNEIAVASARASSKDQVLGTAAALASRVRKALGDETSGSAQLFAMKTLSVTSIDVLRHYAAAVEAQSRGKYEEARQSLLKAVELDPKFGLGYQGLAIMSRILGNQQEVDKYTSEALRHLEGMTERERLAVRASYYMMTGDSQQCVKEYGELIAQYAADAVAHNNRALCLSKLRKMREAVDAERQATRILPNVTAYRGNLALYANYGGDFQTAEQETGAIREPTDLTTLAVAFARLGQARLQQAGETYQKLGAIGPRGPSWAASGMGDLALYQGRFSEAVRIFQQGAAADLASKSADKAARKLTSLANVYLMRGQKAAAAAAAEKALLNSQTVPIRFLAARVFVAAGAVEKARALAAGLAKEIPAEPQAYAKIIEGEMALKSGDARQAIKILTDAGGVVDTWLGHFDLGLAYFELGAFPQADSEFDRCVKRRGEALSLLVDEEPTYGYFPIVYYYQGRVREGMNNAASADSYREYLKIRGESTEDPLLPEVRRRAGA